MSAISKRLALKDEFSILCESFVDGNAVCGWKRSIDALG